MKLDITQLITTKELLRKMPRKATEKLNETLSKSTGKTSDSTTSKSTKATNFDLANLDTKQYTEVTKQQKQLEEVKLNGSDLSKELPKVDFEASKVTDPLNPPEDKQFRQTDSERARVAGIYAERLNYWATTKDAFKDSGARFDAMGEQSAAIQKGISAADKQEKARGSFIDYLKTKESNKEKYVNYRVQEYKTGNSVLKAAQTKRKLDAELSKSQHEASKAELETNKALSDLNSFREQITGTSTK